MIPWENAKNAHVATGRDGIDALPDSVLEHILGFLPARDAVRTCVLARRWCHLWKWAPALCIVCVEEKWDTLVDHIKFVDNLLSARGLRTLERCELRFGMFDQGPIDMPLEDWIQHVVLCQVQFLRVDNIFHDYFELCDLSLVSRNLVRLEIVGIVVNNDFCDLSGCPSLEYLEFGYCDFCGIQKISSESLKCLSITSCSFGSYRRTRIYAPSLVSLRLDDHWCRTPCFQTVPSLHEAFVRVTPQCANCCNDESRRCDSENYCFACEDMNKIKPDISKCLNLDGLSESENLSWIVETKVFLTRDLEKLPTFGKLKTLLLNEQWCVAPGFHALTCILKHSPVLEKLTLQLFCEGHKHKYRMKGIRNPMGMSAAISEHLKIVHVKSVVVNEYIRKVLMFLRTLNFRFSPAHLEILKD